MKTTECSVGEFKAHFSEMLKRVERGETVAVTYGRQRSPVAVLVSATALPKPGKRRLGAFADQLEVEFSEDWKFTEETFLEG